MRLSRILGLGLVLAACTGAPAEVGPAVAATGTYAVQFCRGACAGGDSSAAFATGVLVLQSRPILATLVPTARARLDTAGAIDRPLNACYAVRVRRRPGGTLLGVVQRAVMHWWPPAADSTVRFEMFSSPDASYHVDLRWRPDSLRGRGASFMAGPADADSMPADSVVAWRTGAAEPEACTRFPVDTV
jgi:hypothetical protein